MFYNIFFDMNEHIVLVDSADLHNCLSRVQRAVIICLAPPSYDVSGMEGSNDLIILNDPMSHRLAFNILNHILDDYQEFEHKLNDILYTTHSFQDMIEVITETIELPLSLTDVNFRYIAYSSASGRYIDQYVTASNGLPEDIVVSLQQNESFRRLEGITEAFVGEGAEPCVCKNIYHDGQYVGRLAVIIPDEETDTEYLKAIFDFAASYIEILYAQYNSFTNVSMEYRKVHDYMHLIFRRQPADRRAFLTLMHHLQIEESDALAVVNLLPRHQESSLYSSAFTCEHLERIFPGCFCISLEESIIILISNTYYQRKTGKNFSKELEKELQNHHYIAGISRIFHSLTIFEMLFAARRQALYALEQMDQSETTPASQTTCFFDDYALSYLLQHGASDTNFQQNCHPALIALKEHDEQNATEYLKTLRTYMDANMNAVAAANRLYIHRSSFINRMERIHKLVQLDLNDPNERLYINLSFAVFL